MGGDPPSSSVHMTPEEIEACVDAQAAAVGLSIAPEHRPGVLYYFALAASLADLVHSHELTLADEPAPVFTPVPPSE
jgi:hypothetical protein